MPSGCGSNAVRSMTDPSIADRMLRKWSAANIVSAATFGSPSRCDAPSLELLAGRAKIAASTALAAPAPSRARREGNRTSDQRREFPDVVVRLVGQRTAGRKMLFVSPRTGVAGGEKAGATEAIEHLAQIRCSGKNVVTRLKRIVAQTV